MFIDEAEIIVRSGKGGDGCLSFRREKYEPFGGPDGGNGGNGGDVILQATPGVDTLLDFKGKHHWKAANGRPGESKVCTGARGADLVVELPVGTVVYDSETGVMLKDLAVAGERCCIVRGGRGGRGNRSFATPTHQTPREVEPGEPAEERHLRLELKLIADVGLVGLPNAGKSTLLSRVTRARPKIAAYPFTTLRPQLGIVELSGERRFVIADIPGLIEGAHEGAGLGDAFLKHIERTRVIVHLVDLHPMDGRTPLEAYRTIRTELGEHSAALASKPELVVGNKLDLAADDAALRELGAALGAEVLGISAATGQGLTVLTERLWQLLREHAEPQEENTAGTIERPAPPHLRTP
ncbi:MAG TPA: GTPase ObgE [Phycisphaerae bacterium]|nr:GTPase ObgE [Phycisphaerae bacterium]